MILENVEYLKSSISPHMFSAMLLFIYDRGRGIHINKQNPISYMAILGG